MKKVLFLFGELNDDDLDWIIGTGQLEKIPIGTTLLREGEPSNSLYILLEGAAAVSITVLDSSREIAQLEGGEVFGEMSFIENSVPSATVETIEESLILSIPWNQLATRLYQDIGFASRFYRAVALFLSSRLRSLGREMHYEKEYLSEMADMKDLPPAFLDNLPFAEVRFNWLLRRVKNLQEQQEIF